MINAYTVLTKYFFKYYNPIFYNSILPKHKIVKEHIIESTCELRTDNLSVKVDKCSGGKFLLTVKKYILGLPITINKITVEDREAAEDYLVSLNVEYFKIADLRNDLQILFTDLSYN